MSRWHAVRIRDDLYRAIQAQAAADARSIAQMTDRLLSGALDPADARSIMQMTDRALSGALEQGTNTSASSGGGQHVPGESERGAGVGQQVEPASSPARAPEGFTYEHTTVDEMLASCPNCAGEFVEGVKDGRTDLVCQDCGFVRKSDAP